MEQEGALASRTVFRICCRSSSAYLAIKGAGGLSARVPKAPAYRGHWDLETRRDQKKQGLALRVERDPGVSEVHRGQFTSGLFAIELLRDWLVYLSIPCFRLLTF